MSARLIFIAHAETEEMRRGIFSSGEGLPVRGRRAAERLSGLLPEASVFAAPSAPARETAQALGLRADDEPALADLSVGQWAGRALAEIAATDAAAAQAWIDDPDFRGHGGESLVDLVYRVDKWLGTACTTGVTIAVAQPAILRAAAVVAIGAAPSAFWRVDVPPLTVLALASDGRRWSMRELRPLSPTGQPAL